MDVLSGPVAVLDGNDCVVLGPQLAEAIRAAYVKRGRPPPHALLQFSIAVNKLARGTSGTGCGAGQGTAAEPAKFRTGPSLPSSELPVKTLTVAEAAFAAEVSTGYLRRLIRRGDVEASRDSRSAGYLVQADSFTAWLGQRERRKETGWKVVA